jgi:hypothetical protein
MRTTATTHGMEWNQSSADDIISLSLLCNYIYCRPTPIQACVNFKPVVFNSLSYVICLIARAKCRACGVRCPELTCRKEDRYDTSKWRLCTIPVYIGISLHFKTFYFISKDTAAVFGSL